jgi:hypothetical protein
MLIVVVVVVFMTLSVGVHLIFCSAVLTFSFTLGRLNVHNLDEDQDCTFLSSNGNGEHRQPTQEEIAPPRR